MINTNDFPAVIGPTCKMMKDSRDQGRTRQGHHKPAERDTRR
jgi:hypothetical protein